MMPGRSLSIYYIVLPLFASTCPCCHSLIRWHRATSGERLTPSIVLSLSLVRFAFVRRERKEGNKESEWQRETIKRANMSEIKRQRKARTKENLMWVEYAVSDNKADCCIHRQQLGQHGKRKKGERIRILNFQPN